MLACQAAPSRNHQQQLQWYAVDAVFFAARAGSRHQMAKQHGLRGDWPGGDVPRGGSGSEVDGGDVVTCIMSAGLQDLRYIYHVMGPQHGFRDRRPAERVGERR